MKRVLKITLLASAAVFIIGATAPSFAQQNTTQAATAQRQRVYQPVQPDRSAATRQYDAAAEASEPFAFQPAPPSDSCSTDGSYGQGVDYGACNGGN